MDDDFTPDCGDSSSGGGGCGGGDCKLDDDGFCDGAKQFLVVASDGFRDSLRIPEEVGSHLRNMIPQSEIIVLKAPDGRIYPVQVSRELGAVVLRSGWHKFVYANHIQEYYTIQFVYHGHSIFKIQIFDSSGQEKSSSCSQPPSGISGAVPPCAPSDHHVLNEQLVPDPGHVQISNDIVYPMTRIPEPAPVNLQAPDIPKRAEQFVVPDPGHVQASNKIPYTTLAGCRLTKEQHEKVLEIARTKKPEIPLHVASMNRRNVNLKDPCIYLPLGLVLNHFKDERSKAIIQLEAPDNSICSVGASKHNDGQEIVLDSGWDTFVTSQRVQEKDLLIFRSTEKIWLEVRILDPSGHEKIMGNSSSTQETSGGSVHIVAPPPHTVIELSSSDDDDDDIMRGATKRVTRSCAKAQKMASTSSPCTKSGCGGRKAHDRASVKVGVGSEPLSNSLGGPSHCPYILAQFGATLPWQMKNKIEEKVKVIRSEVPIFVKVMTKTCVDDPGSKFCAMHFCKEYSSAYLPSSKEALLLRLEGKQTEWETMMAVRKEDKVRLIQTGWREFSGQNGLEVGDVCLFQLASGESSTLTMTVHVIRKSEI